MQALVHSKTLQLPSEHVTVVEFGDWWRTPGSFLKSISLLDKPVATVVPNEASISTQNKQLMVGKPCYQAYLVDL